MRSASRLSCAVPVDAVVNPGSSNITHEPASSSFTLMFRDGLSVVTLYSLPARTLVSPSAVNSLPLRLRTTGGPEGARVPLIRPPPGAMAIDNRLSSRSGGTCSRTGGARAGTLRLVRHRHRDHRHQERRRHHRDRRTRRPPPPPKPPNPTAPPPPPTFMRPISPLHTTAFQVGLASQALSASIPVTLTMVELGTPVMVPSLSLNTEVL